MPDPLTAHEHAVWSAVKHIGEHALSSVAAAIEARTGLSGPEFGVLSRIADPGQGAIGQADLARALGWHRSRLSHQLTRMETAGLVTREPHPGSNAVTIRITREAAARLAAARPVHADCVRALILFHLTPAEQQMLLVLSDRLSRTRNST